MSSRRSTVPAAALLLALAGCSGSSSPSFNGAGGGPGPFSTGGNNTGSIVGRHDGGPPLGTDANNVYGTGGSPGTGGVEAYGGLEATGGASARGGAVAAGGGFTGSIDAGATRPDVPPPSCTVNIAPSSGPSLVGRPAGDTLTVQGTIVWGISTPTAPVWNWTVKGPDGTPVTTTPGATADIIQFPLLTPGNYDINVSVTSSCKGHASASAVRPLELSQSFFIRVLPPPDPNAAGSGQTCDNSANRWCPSQDAVPYEDSKFVLQAGQSRQTEFQFLHGFPLSIDPVIAGQTNNTAFPAVAVPSLILVSPQGSTWTIDGASDNGGPMHALLNRGLSYDILVVPTNADTTTTTYPPLLVSKPAQEFRPEDFDLAAGVAVQGTLKVPGGLANGPQGALLLLRASANAPVTLPLPSTVGSADATGAYSLRANAGTLFSAMVVPPPGVSLPQVTIDNCIDLGQSANGDTFDHVDFTWNAISTTTLTLRVLMSDNSTPAANTSVRLQSQDGALPNAGVLSIAGTAWTGAVTGSLQQQGTTDASGTIVFANIPKVAYNLTLMPPSGLSEATITTFSTDLAGAGNSISRSLTLKPKVKLSGRLSPAGAASGAHLVATDTGADILVSIISTPVASDGSYEFPADPGRTYRLSVEPAAGNNLPTRIPLYGFTTLDQDSQSLGERNLPSGLKVSGTVTFAGLGVSGAIVQTYCEWVAVAGCVDPNDPTATLPPPMVEFATLSDGSYSFYLPDPQSGD